MTISNVEGDINPDPRIELNGQGEFTGTHNLIFSVVKFIDRLTIYFVLDKYKELKYVSCVQLFTGQLHISIT